MQTYKTKKKKIVHILIFYLRFEAIYIVVKTAEYG